MSHYLIEQLARKVERRRSSCASEVVAVHGDTHLTAIDIRDAASGEVRRHDCGGLFVFIGADAETGWLPADIARDARGYVLTGDDVVKAGRWSHEPRSLPARIERPGRLRLRRRAAEPGQARRLRGRRGQHGDRFRPQVSAAGRAVASERVDIPTGRTRVQWCGPASPFADSDSSEQQDLSRGSGNHLDRPVTAAGARPGRRSA